MDSGIMVPVSLPSEVQELPSSSMQAECFRGNRGSLSQVIVQAIESAAGTAGITSTIGQMHALSGQDIYRVVSGTLQQDKTGFFRGVYYQDGKIVAHAIFEKANIAPWESAIACSTQLMMIGFALQLNQIQKTLKDIKVSVDAIHDQLHKTRISKINAGVNQVEDIFMSEDFQALGLSAFQSLHEGLQDCIHNLDTEISMARKSMRLPTRLQLTGMSEETKWRLTMLQETFMWILKGMQAQTECQAMLGLREAIGPRMKDTLVQLRKADLEAAADLSSRIPYEDGKELPERPWESFMEICPEWIKRAEELTELYSDEKQVLELAIAIDPEEFKGA